MHHLGLHRQKPLTASGYQMPKWLLNAMGLKYWWAARLFELKLLVREQLRTRTVFLESN